MTKSKSHKRKRFIYDEGNEVDSNAGRVGTVLPGLDGAEKVHFLSPRKHPRMSNLFPECPPPPPSLMGSTQTTIAEDAAPPRVENPVQHESHSETPAAPKINNTIAPHKYMGTFITWAQKLLDIFRAREADPLIGQPCTLCPVLARVLEEPSLNPGPTFGYSQVSTAIDSPPSTLQAPELSGSHAEGSPFNFATEPSEPSLAFYPPVDGLTGLAAIATVSTAATGDSNSLPPTAATDIAATADSNPAVDANVDPLSPPALAYYRCDSCFNPPPLCETCIVRTHVWNPLHRIKHWNGTHFTDASLADLGHVIQLGHRGSPCPSMHKKVVSKPLTVIHSNGIHKVRIRYCQCQKNEENPFPEEPLQLWSASLWPATYKQPETAFTLEALKHYDRLTLQAKTTAQDFFATLRRLTNHIFNYVVVDRYREFMTAYRGFTYLQALKRSGLDVQEKLEPRSLAVLCPACPQPENMDPEWHARPRKERYLDALHYAKDGNFVLCHHSKKMDLLDTALTDGAAFYVDNQEYKEFLHSVEDDPDAQEETGVCNEFKAGRTKYSGKIKSGQVSMSCSRHGFVMPTGTVDITGGEKYGPVDWATISALLHWIGFIILLFSSYDINCKYGINWLRRLTKIVGLDRVKLWPLIRRCVPKWHANAHSGVCRWINSFYFMPGAGQTDGEEPERRWAVMNLLGRAIREMSPGHRIDTLNHHYSDYNIQKLFRLARTLRKKWDAAVSASTKQAEDLADFEVTLRANNLPLSEWKNEERLFLEQMLEGTLDQKEIKNPYQPPPDTAPSLKAVRAQLRADDVKATRGTTKKTENLRKDLDNPVVIKARLTELFLDGLQIDDEQRAILHHIQELAKNRSAPDQDEIAASPTVKRLRRALAPKLAMWYQTHSILFASLLEQVQADPTLSKLSLPSRDTDCDPEDEALLFPHLYPASLRQAAAFGAFIEAERDVRRAQASDALREIRQKQGLHAFLWKKTAGTFGQQAKTRNQTTLRDVKDKIEAARQAYERARIKLDIIADSSDKQEYPPLTAQDCREMTIYHHQEAPGMKRKEVSWIWRDGKAYGTESDPYVLQAVRIEWFRASARSQRWNEEKLLLEVEMRRTQRWYDFQYRQWRTRSSEKLKSGLVGLGQSAYAARQAERWLKLFQDARERFPVEQHVPVVDTSSE